MPPWSGMLTVDEVRYVNWRFVMRGNIDGRPPVAPGMDGFWLTYRL